MNIFFKTIKIITLIFICSTFSYAQDEALDWREQMELLVYTPRYFGPNAFPISDLHSGRIDNRWEAELRGEYHYYTGDKTSDVYARLFIPIANGKAAVELSGVITEDYETTSETQTERHAAETKPPFQCFGDLIVSSYYQIIRSDRWCDIMVSANLKTASGNRLCDARYTDAASYWFDATFGRNLFQSEDKKSAIRIQGMVGFYCWMTNDMTHRQDDAFLYGGGISGIYNNVSLAIDCSGFHGYENKGDNPVTLRTKFNYEFKKNIISVRYKHGIRDNLYDTYSLAYIRCF